MSCEKYCIYVIKNSINNKLYVGSTSNIKRRWQNHKNPSYHRHKFGNPLYEDMDKFGRENFWYEILETVKDENVAYQREEFWTRELNTEVPNGYNRDIAHKHTDEYSKKYSYGDKNPFYGKKHTDATKNKISQANKGRRHSDESRKKMSYARSGGKNYNAKKVRCVDNGMVFDCCGDAGKWCGIGAKAISKCCRGETKTAGNHKWEYINDAKSKI